MYLCSSALSCFIEAKAWPDLTDCVCVHIARHDCFVDLIASEVRQVVSPTAHMQKHYCVRGSWFDVDNVFFCVPNTSDIVVVVNTSMLSDESWEQIPFCASKTVL